MAEPPSENKKEIKVETEKSFEASVVKQYPKTSVFKKILPWLISVFSFSFTLGLFYVFWIKRKEKF